MGAATKAAKAKKKTTKKVTKKTALAVEEARVALRGAGRASLFGRDRSGERLPAMNKEKADAVATRLEQLAALVRRGGVAAVSYSATAGKAGSFVVVPGRDYHLNHTPEQDMIITHGRDLGPPTGIPARVVFDITENRGLMKILDTHDRVLDTKEFRRERALVGVWSETPTIDHRTLGERVLVQHARDMGLTPDTHGGDAFAAFADFLDSDDSLDHATMGFARHLSALNDGDVRHATDPGPREG